MSCAAYCGSVGGEAIQQTLRLSQHFSSEQRYLPTSTIT